MSLLADKLRRFVYKTTPSYIRDVLKGDVYNLRYRRGLFESKAILQPAKNANGPKLIYFLTKNQNKQLPIEVPEGSGFATDKKSIVNFIPGYCFIYYRNGKIQLDEKIDQTNGIALGSISKNIGKGKIIFIQTVRQDLFSSLYKAVLLLNVILIYTLYAYNEVQSAGIARHESWKEIIEIRATKNQHK